MLERKCDNIIRPREVRQPVFECREAFGDCYLDPAHVLTRIPVTLSKLLWMEGRPP